MKKFFIFMLALMTAFSAFSVSVYSVDENFDAVISAPEKAAPGDTISVIVSVCNIDVDEGTYSDGIFSTAFTLLFDPQIFEPVDYTAVIPTDWEHFDRRVDFAEGKWTVFTAWDDGPLDGLTKDNVIVVTYSLKIIGVPDGGSASLKIADVQGSNGSMRLFYGTGSEATILMEAFIPKKDSNLRLDKNNNTIFSAVNNVKASEFVKLFLCDASKISVKNNGVVVSDVALVSTGMTVSDGVDTYTVIIKGDVDLDGKVTANDYTAVKTHFKTSTKLTGVAFKAADVDENGSAATSDYLSIRRYIAGRYVFKV